MKEQHVTFLKNELQKLNINIHKFNYVNIALIIITSIVATVGLLINNYQFLLASKIIGLALIPFIALYIKLFSLDIKQISLAGLNCLIFFTICLVVSFIIGIINSATNYITEYDSDTIDRLSVKNKNMYLDLIMAFITGIGLYYAVIKNSIVAFIGLLLVVSIVPPICNAGLFLGISLHKSINKKSDSDANTDLYLSYAVNSIKLFLVNIIGILIGFCSTILIYSFFV